MRKIGLLLALGLLLVLGLLSACGGPSASFLTVKLVDGLGEPLQPQAAAWRVGSGNWVSLATGQSSWVLPLPATSNDIFAVAFQCPSTNPNPSSYVSLEAKRNEVGNTLLLRCPLDWSSTITTVSGSATPTMNGMVYSARGQAPLNNGSFSGLNAPQGSGREVAALGNSGGTFYFGRSGLITIPSSPTLTLSPTATNPLTVITTNAVASLARVHLNTGVTVDLAFWGGGSQAVPRPNPSALAPGELLEVHAEHGVSLSILRLANQDSQVAPGSTVNLPVPPFNFTVGQTHTATALPTFTGTPLWGVGFSLSPLGYALLLAEPGVRYWRHFVSPGAATGGPSYTFNLEQAPGFSGVVPSPGSNVQLCASAFASDQGLASLLASRPLPQETSPCYTLFIDRHHPGHLEVARASLNFTW